MDVSLLYKGKGKGGKGYNNNYSYGKGKPSTPIGQSNNYKGYTPIKGGYKGKGPPQRRRATDVDRWDTWQRTAEYEYTT